MIVVVVTGCVVVEGTVVKDVCVNVVVVVVVIGEVAVVVVVDETTIVVVVVVVAIHCIRFSISFDKWVSRLYRG